ncbi:unnamed protein product [Parnassius apollo]|uniref:(apollo) hypothetical protein n=1 Tax=Parnassius apollo TaxID=110799 RepID=A0A8S3W4N6_PARAO|nr:unnamed protein product [Parnassius apollo]
MSGARSRRLVKLAISTSTGVFSEEQASSVSWHSLSQEDSTKKNVEVTAGAQVQSPSAEFIVEQHIIREQEWFTHPSKAKRTPEIGVITPSGEFVMEYTTQTHPVETERHDKNMKNQLDTDFSSGSDELYAPPESENDREVQADDCVGSVIEISIQDGQVANVTSQQQSQPISDTDKNIPDQEQPKPRKRKGQVNTNAWKRFKNAKLRLEGKSYVGFGKQKSGKYKQNKIKEAKCLGPRCNGHPQPTTVKGGPKQDFKCDTISEDDRKSIHSHFWNLSSWEAKKSLRHWVCIAGTSKV